MHFGDTVIPGILNDSTTAQAFIEMLPITVHESRYSHDFCGSMGDFLPFDEEVSEQYGNLVNIGVIDCELSAVSELEGSYDVLIELAE